MRLNWSCLLALVLVLSDRGVDSLFILGAKLLDLILSVNLLANVLVSFHELVEFLGQFLVLLGDYSDVVLEAVDFVLHFCVFVNLSLFGCRMSICCLF